MDKLDEIMGNTLGYGKVKLGNSILSIDELGGKTEKEIIEKYIECQHYELKNEGNEGYGRCVKCGEEVRIY